MLADHAVPHTNRYSFTAPGAPWIHHAWGGSVVLALVDRAGGWPALVLVLALAYATAVTLVYRRSRSLAWTAVGALLLLGAHAAKPDALATPLCAAMLLVLADERRARFAPLLLVPWANLHGSFLVGLGLVALYDAAARRFPWRTVAAAAACTLSPYGPGVFAPPLRYALDPELRAFLRALGVWQPPSGAVAALLVLALAVAIVLVLRAGPPGGPGRARRAAELALVAAAAAAAWTAVRHVPLFAVLAAPAVAARAALSPAPRFAHVLGALVTAALATTLVLAPPAPPASPVPAALLRAPLPARLLHPFDWGGALLAAGVPVAIDARNDCYPPRVRADVLAALTRGAVAAFVRRYRVDGALAPAGSRLDRRLRALGFRELRRAGGVVLLGGAPSR